jgi:8-oxo-dGTP diphosphatase
MSATKLLYPLVSVDVALFSVDQDVLRVLLVKRSVEPEFKKWALPGAVLKPDVDVDLEATALRALKDKISVDVPHLEQVSVFSGTTRDPRGWSLAVLFYALLPRDQINAVIKSKVEAVEWAEARDVKRRLAFDHAEQLECALSALVAKVEGFALPLHLVGARFTLTELQRVCEAVLGRGLDKSVFRRRLKGVEDLVEVEDEVVRGAQRPAQVWRKREGFEF